MSSKYFQKCSRSLTIKGCKLNLPCDPIPPPQGECLPQGSDDCKCWHGVGESRTLIYWWWKKEIVEPLWKSVWKLLRKLEIKLPYSHALSVLCMLKHSLPSCRNACTFIFAADTLTIAMKWNQPRCLSTSHRIRKRGYTMESYLSIKMKSQNVQKMDITGKYYTK